LFAVLLTLYVIYQYYQHQTIREELENRNFRQGKELSQTQENLQQAKQEIQSLNSENDKKTHVTKSLQSQLEQVEQELNAEKAERSAASKEVSSLRIVLMNATDQLKKAETSFQSQSRVTMAKLETCNSDLIEMRNELAGLRNDLKMCNQQHIVQIQQLAQQKQQPLYNPNQMNTNQNINNDRNIIYDANGLPLNGNIQSKAIDSNQQMMNLKSQETVQIDVQNAAEPVPQVIKQEASKSTHDQEEIQVASVEKGSETGEGVKIQGRGNPATGQELPPNEKPFRVLPPDEELVDQQSQPVSAEDASKGEKSVLEHELSNGSIDGKGEHDKNSEASLGETKSDQIGAVNRQHEQIVDKVNTYLKENTVNQ